MAKARIMVVEDEGIVARDLQRTLVRMGYEVVAVAASGEDALARAAELRPDLVLMDIHLAGELDGIATAKQMRQAHALPVVFLTAHSDDATFQRAQVTEPFGYVLKPFEERELEIAVSVALYRYRAETKLAQMERWLATTLSSIGDAVIATDLAGAITFVNQQAETLTGWTVAQALGQPLDQVLRLVQAGDHAPVGNLVARALLENTVIELGPNTLLLARDGREHPVHNSAAPIRDSAGTMSGFVIVFRDITSQKQTEDQLRHSALHDTLTGLPNRALLADRLEHAFEHARRHPEHDFALLYLDLDGFKAINDSLGHLAGDHVLIVLARRLESSLRGEDTVARLGGDEFVILLQSIENPRAATQAAARIQQSVAGTIQVEGQNLQVGVSVGLVVYGPEYEQAVDMLRAADAALYRAKSQKKGRLALADDERHTGVLKLLALENELRQAARAGEFRVWYQPIVTLAGGLTCGQEALLRWQHPARGLLAPGEFLSLMEETSQLVEVGDWVLRQACRQASAWGAGAAGNTVSVNLSPKQFRQTGLPEQVAGALADSGLAPSRLCLDIPERALAMHDQPLEALNRLHALGVRLHLDDFGSGPIALSLLQQAPFDALKLGPAAVAAGLAGTTRLLARALGLQVIGKGLETPGQVEQLHALGFQLGQGFWLGAVKEGV